ncbi:MAG: recombinase RecA [Thermoleophilia bacterium]|nr:recombinase RecA [Thermoleophilia bacterium]
MEKSQALGTAVAQIERAFGKGSIMRMGDMPAIDIQAVPTGSLALDVALGIGGLPRGRIVEIFGPEASGKTTLLYHVIAQAQKRGGLAAFIDAEHAMDPGYARRIGVNTDDLLVSQPDHGEQALEIADLLIRSGALDVVAIDSVAALVPKAEIEGEMGDTHVGLQARLMSQALRKLAGTLNRAGTICVFTNQLREKIGVMFGCFHHDAPVALADGSTLPIGRIVTERLPVEVMSLDPLTGRIEPRPVVSWFDNGQTEGFLRIRVSGGREGARTLVCTPNHLIITPQGEVPAGDLAPGMEVFASAPAVTGAAVRAGAAGAGTPAGSALRAVRAFVLGVEPVSGLADMRRFDLEVAGHHTYLVDGVAVHNSPETTPGGRALKFYSSVRLDIRRIENLKEGAEVIGSRARVKVVKNKVAPPFRQAEFDIMYGEGISHEGNLIDLGLEHGLLTKSGAYFSYGDERLGQGRNAAKAFLREHPDVAGDLEAQIRRTAGVDGSSGEEEIQVDADGVVIAGAGVSAG